MTGLPPIVERAVEAFSKLPGVGKKTALRYVLHLLKQSGSNSSFFLDSTKNLLEEIQYCHVCHNLSEEEICEICSNPSRDTVTVCVVESIREVITIENTAQFKGLYHVLGGIISPIDGIGPNDLEIDSLISRVQENDIKEVILALSTTMEGDTTSFYISKKLKDVDVNLTVLARGISVGGELEYTDEITLGRSIRERVPYQI